MKILYMIGFIVIFTVTIHVVPSGFAESESLVVSDKAIPSISIQPSLETGDQFDQDGTIFSKSTVIFLLVAVIGIVAFRRNSYS